MSVSGPKETEFSEMSPKSKTIVEFFDCVPAIGIWAQNSRFSAREISTPLGLRTVRTDRHLRPAGTFGTVQRKVLVLSCPPMDSGYSVSQSIGSGPEMPVP